MTAVARPVLRYHGGKWRLAPWIISHFPAHRVYVDPFGGAASVLMRKPRSYAEVYNDLDGEVVNVFRVLRDPAQSCELARLMELTPFARREFEASGDPCDEPVEQARRTMFRFAAGFATGSQHTYATGFRNNVTRLGSTPATDWRRLPEVVPAISERLRGVVIECRPALDVMLTFDTRESLFYVDPPYVFETRNARNAGSTYRHEMTDDQHRELLTFLRGLRGMVVLSGYRCPLYDEMLTGWQRVDKATHADGARGRVESLWLSPNITPRNVSMFEDKST